MITPSRLRPHQPAPCGYLPLGLLLLCWLLAVLVLPAAAQEGGVSGDPGKLLDEGRADDALHLLAAQASGNNAAAFNYLGRVYYSLEDWDNAAKNCERAVQLEPRNAIFQLWLARSYGEKASVASPVFAFALARKSVAAFTQARVLDRQNMAIARDLAEYYSAAPQIVGGGVNKALALAAELAPEHPSDAAWVRAMAASSAGHNEQAEQEYREAIRLDHDSATTYLDLAHFLKGRNSWDRFQQTVERALQSARIRPADRYNAAEMLLRTNRNLDEAARQMRAYIQGGHTQEEAPVFRAHFLLGEILLKTGDASEAAAEYRAALALASSYRPASEALRRLGQHESHNRATQ
jgi:tetratricopeptide (TPR) repeat protein